MKPKSKKILTGKKEMRRLLKSSSDKYLYAFYYEDKIYFSMNEYRFWGMAGDYSDMIWRMRLSDLAKEPEKAVRKIRRKNERQNKK